MKSKIFSLSLMALTASIAFCTPNFAQETPVPQVPRIDITIPDISLNLDEKSLKDGMKRLKLDLQDLNLKMKCLDSNEVNISMKNLGDNLKFSLDDLTQDLAVNIKNITSSINLSFKDLDIPASRGFNDEDNNVHFSSPWSDEELKEKIKSGEATERIKNFTKTYTVDANDKLRIDNRYGKVIVNTWNKNIVKVDVEIKAESNNDSNAQKLLDAVQINDSKDDNVISFLTKINSDWSSDSFSWTGMTKLRKIEVNYIIYMPSKMPLQVTNRYGGTELPDLDGPVIVYSSYGSLVAKSLSNTGNQIRVSYGSANISSLTSSEVNVSYGSLDLGSVDQINANVSYGSAKIGKISTSGNINIRYSSPLQIADLDRGLKSLSVNSSYSGVRVGLSGDENADFDVTVKNGSFDYHDGVSVTSKTPPDNARGWSPTKNYKGHVGKGNADKMITITSSYGSVKFE